jgi:hypothetical protein
MRQPHDPVTLTSEIFVMMDKYEPAKAKHAKHLTEHISGQRTLLSTEEEL